MSTSRLPLSLLVLCASLAGGCSVASPREAATPIARETTQLVVVTTADWDANAGELRRYVREGARWRAVSESIPTTIGRKGSAWGRGLHPAQDGPQKREGDGRAPAGVFGIGTAFGYAPRLEAGWPYAAMDRGDWCIDVPASPLYNRIVDVADVGAEAIEGSTEPMRRDLHAGGDARYALGFVVEHNVEGEAGAGSCIFAHVWKAPGEPTAGCTAMDEAALRALVAWLDPAAKPVFVLLPEAEYSRLRVEWALP